MGDLPDEFEESFQARSELKFDLLKMEDQEQRREQQEVHDRLRSIQHFNDDEHPYSNAHVSPNQPQHNPMNMLADEPMHA